MTEVTTRINIKEKEKINKDFAIHKPKMIFYNIIKRIVDIIASIIGILLIIPITIIVWIMNKIAKESGPIFYKHTRVGKDGKEFKLHKFRTMYTDADVRLQNILEENKELKKEWENHRKLTNDPRVTKSGRILRKTSLDEFPNFIDVFLGKMSLVGPRAVVPNELEKFGEYKDEILKVKPGITGYWAVNGRSNTTYEERVEMELYYVRNASLLLDIKIIIKTVISVLKKDGAM